MRAYPADHLWATYSVDKLGEAFEEATYEGFEHLFSYISGANADGTKIDMTAPVWTRIEAGAGPFCKSHFKVAFSVPAKLQGDAPKPTDAQVALEPTGAALSCVAVRGFGGHAKDTNIIAESAALAQELADGGWVFDASAFVVAQYDDPYTPSGRHNEILLPLSPSACASASV